MALSHAGHMTMEASSDSAGSSTIETKMNVAPYSWQVPIGGRAIWSQSWLAGQSARDPFFTLPPDQGCPNPILRPRCSRCGWRRECGTRRWWAGKEKAGWTSLEGGTRRRQGQPGVEGSWSFSNKNDQWPLTSAWPSQSMSHPTAATEGIVFSTPVSAKKLINEKFLL